MGMVKNYQVQWILALLKTFPKEYPVIFAGDCNTNPVTDAYAQLNKGFANIGMRPAYNHKHVDQKKVKTLKQCEELDRQRKENGLPAYRVSSAKYRKGGNQPNKCKEVDQNIDHIFQRGFITTQTKQIPRLQDVIRDTNGMRLPSWKMPSDHLPIGATFEYRS